MSRDTATHVLESNVVAINFQYYSKIKLYCLYRKAAVNKFEKIQGSLSYEIVRAFDVGLTRTRPSFKNKESCGGILARDFLMIFLKLVQCSCLKIIIGHEK